MGWVTDVPNIIISVESISGDDPDVTYMTIMLYIS